MRRIGCFVGRGGLARGLAVALGASTLLAAVLLAHRDPDVVVAGATALFFASLLISAILDHTLRRARTG